MLHELSIIEPNQGVDQFMNHTEYEIASINVGVPTTIVVDGKELTTGIFKQPINKSVFLSYLNFEGDGQADLVHHGGKDKAVCVYPYEHYIYWEEKLGVKLTAGAFGENLTVNGLNEESARIGDIYQLGEAVVQITQPREPCYKIAKKHGIKEFPLLIQQTGYSGFYMRVLQEGEVSIHDKLKLIAPHPLRVTISLANRIMFKDKNNRREIEKILSVQELSENWRKRLLNRR